AEQAKSNLEKAKGTVAQQLAQAAGHLEQVKLQADADYYQNQKRAEAILAEKKARAKGIQKENEALAGAGGKTLVKLRLAEALAGKEILFVPTGKGGGGLQTLNVNQLLGTYAGSQALEGSGASAEPVEGERKAKKASHSRANCLNAKRLASACAGFARTRPDSSVSIVSPEVGHLLLAQFLMLGGIPWIRHLGLAGKRLGRSAKELADVVPEQADDSDRRDGD